MKDCETCLYCVGCDDICLGYVPDPSAVIDPWEDYSKEDIAGILDDETKIESCDND